MRFRKLCGFLALSLLAASGADAQPVTITVAPLGVRAPFGNGFLDLGPGGAAEVSFRYHRGNWAVGPGFRNSSFGDRDVGRDVSVATVFLEGRYGKRFSDGTLSAGRRFYPYGALRVGYTEFEREVSDFLTLTRDGFEAQPVVGFQQWFSRNLAFDANAGVSLGSLNGEFAGSFVFQTALVIGL